MARAKVLLIEDNKIQGQIAKDFLQQSGYEVIWERKGVKGIDAAKSQEVDVVLLDRVLPDIEGDEVCRWLKINPSTSGVPVIIVTAKISTTEKATGLEAGADDYVSKPYDELELGARIYACLRNKALRDELREKNRELEDMLRRVEVLAITDHLTEMFNRRRFLQIMEKEFRRVTRYKCPLSCLMIDIDNFKEVNDRLGHKVGDQVLRELARIILSTIREVDTPARWGGEEFVVLLPETEKEQSMHPANRIREKVSEYSFPGLPDRRVTVSVGIAGAPDPTIDSGEKLVHAADLAMFLAKRNGRNRVEVG